MHKRPSSIRVDVFILLYFWWPAAFCGTPKIIWITEKFCLRFCQQFMSAFPIVSKDVAIVYYVTLAPYNSKSILSILCLLKRARTGVFSKGHPSGLFIRFIRHHIYSWY